MSSCNDKRGMKPFKIVPSPNFCDEEAKLIEFCKKNGIRFKKMNDPSSKRGRNSYELVFETPFLDDIERQVVEHCNREGIKYKFASDIDGVHHYEFDQMIELTDNQPDKVIDRNMVMAEMPHIRHRYDREINFVEKDDDIQKLEDSINPKKLKAHFRKYFKPKSRWGKIAYYFTPYYFVVNRRVNKSVNHSLTKKAVENVKDTIESLRVEKEQMRQMLVLAGLIEDENKS